MNWQDIYEKYKSTELMVLFMRGLGYIDGVDWSNLVRDRYCDIQDVWGYLKVFAEFKGIIISVDTTQEVTVCYCDWIGSAIGVAISNDRDSELGMIWCANKMFEL